MLARNRRVYGTHGKLSGNANVTQVQFDTFLNTLLMLWTDVYKDSSAANVTDFRTRLIASLPDEPCLPPPCVRPWRPMNARKGRAHEGRRRRHGDVPEAHIY